MTSLTCSCGKSFTSQSTFWYHQNGRSGSKMQKACYAHVIIDQQKERIKILEMEISHLREELKLQEPQQTNTTNITNNITVNVNYNPIGKEDDSKIGLEKFIEILKNHDELSLVGYGSCIEIFKQVGNPKDVVKNFSLEKFSGSHAIGHTRMATESAITTDGSHPYSTGEDECLVHNGSLSNHNNLRRSLQKKGIEIKSMNDTEVAAGYISNGLSDKKSLKETLLDGLKDLDGFYTFISGTKNGMAIVRDEIACKPAVVAETKDYVAIASEFQAMAHLPNVN